MSTNTEVVIDEKIKKQVDEPLKYNVIFLNDDQTPMEWVVELLMSVFKHSQDSAEYITMTIHTEGSGIVGTYSYEIAEQKTAEAITTSRNQGFPLQITMEAE